MAPCVVRANKRLAIGPRVAEHRRMYKEVMARRRGVRLGWFGALFWAGAAFLIGAVFAEVADSMYRFGSVNRAGATRRYVSRMANVYYPEWLATHPAAGACPKSLADVGDGNLDDAWGDPLRFACVPKLKPAESALFVAISAGADGRFGTPDDIVSDGGD